MCTITFIPGKEKNEFILTDNRDEAVNRPAELPDYYLEQGTQFYYPKDKLAGGTWMGLTSSHQLIALMNGAFARHQRNPPYRKSRGLVLKELLTLNPLIPQIREYNFKGIEAFFALFFRWDNSLEIWEIIWDEKDLLLRPKSNDRPLIWSSMMSYSPEQHAQKEKVFKDFLDRQTNDLTKEAVWDFHHLRKNGDFEGMIIDRGQLKTTSISQFCVSGNGVESFKYEDLLTTQIKEDELVWPLG